ncbi:MAG: hypothetical protein COV91_02130 [Candidatus Taylorbacteria bacterium CG11_big_fil_rev_8_21_14_0_20_46_11]|uniref:YdbS-like PH domain-containing protein n=1 Tax=Candidatus Taylorbacteria bacterium CG11_big_fil_rev_8_21_14_0_20_46_11 TaxID=1975025 RepID=A0A2H0KC88_9BACT|nr:MAG: hypothetical protein COV91_02130 [Candidatus Taylorbacteria bacterium CG11_big_fil_rev_8_21_14_0_20_46_11]
MLRLEADEKVLYVARKHWFLFATETFFLAVLALLPSILFFIPAPFFDEVFGVVAIRGHIISLVTFFWSLWLMFLWMLFALFWTNFYLDVWIVTNFRVIDIDQVGLFNRTISAFRFDHIQDASVKVSGLLATIIDFGTVEIRTASEESFKFKGVAHPHQLKEKILAEHHRVHTVA